MGAVPTRERIEPACLGFIRLYWFNSNDSSTFASMSNHVYVSYIYIYIYYRMYNHYECCMMFYVVSFPSSFISSTNQPRCLLSRITKGRLSPAKSTAGSTCSKRCEAINPKAMALSSASSHSSRFQYLNRYTIHYDAILFYIYIYILTHMYLSI